MIAQASSLQVPEFETLMARFFDGVLSESEDRTLSELLEAHPEHARRFQEQVRMERAIAGLLAARPTEARFVESVMRGVRLQQDGSDTERFARVVALKARHVSQRRSVSQRSSASKRSRKSLRLRRADAAKTGAVWIPVAGAAALVALIVLLSEAPAPRQAPVQAQNETWVPAKRSYRPQPERIAQVPDAPEELDAEASGPELDPELETARQAAEPAPEEAPEPALAEAAPPPLSREEAPNAVHADRPRQASASKPVARIQRIVGVTVQLTAKDQAETLSEGRVLLAGERVAVGTSTLEKSALPTDWKQGVECALEDGGTIWLNPDSILRLAVEGDRCLPTLEAGSMAFQTEGRAQANPWSMKVDAGPEIFAQSAQARVNRDEANRRTVVLVDAGRLELASLGAKSLVVADHGCVVPFKSTPGEPFLFQTLKATGYGAQPPPSAGNGEADGADPAPDSSNPASSGPTSSGAGGGEATGGSTGTGTSAGGEGAGRRAGHTGAAGGSGNGGAGTGNAGGTGNGSGGGKGPAAGSGNGNGNGSGAGSGNGNGSGAGAGKGPGSSSGGGRSGSNPGQGGGKPSTGSGGGEGGSGSGVGRGSGGGGAGGNPPAQGGGGPKTGGPGRGKGR
ncbi:MAG: hypothetical protein M5U26_05130 [Planctomycetota bacterium]|nr:hypothetical protein [Planctomycetota bacterium]